jgi:hypothetical protein
VSAGRRRALRTGAALAGAAAWPLAGRGSDASRGPVARAAARGPAAFALIGDLPYSPADEARLAAMLASADAEPLDFVLHVGDLKSSREPCDDALLERRIGLLERSAHPLVLLPGDNEWVDCLKGEPPHEPLERLPALRRRAWSRPGPLGRAGAAAVTALAFERQPGQPENVRWRAGGVRSVAAHVVGSDNGRKGFAGATAAWAARAAMNRDWVLDTVELARRERAEALAIAFHADPDWQPSPRSGFRDWIEVLRQAADAFPRPILLLHGDSHRFRVDRPLRDAAGRPYGHVTRVESFGWPFTSQWVHIEHAPETAQGFRIAIREVNPLPRA